MPKEKKAIRTFKSSWNSQYTNTMYTLHRGPGNGYFLLARVAPMRLRNRDPFTFNFSFDLNARFLLFWEVEWQAQLVIAPADAG